MEDSRSMCIELARRHCSSGVVSRLTEEGASVKCVFRAEISLQDLERLESDKIYCGSGIVLILACFHLRLFCAVGRWFVQVFIMCFAWDLMFLLFGAFTTDMGFACRLLHGCVLDVENVMEWLMSIRASMWNVRFAAASVGRVGCTSLMATMSVNSSCISA